MLSLHQAVTHSQPLSLCIQLCLRACTASPHAAWTCLQGLALLEAMRTAGGEVMPDTVSYNTALKACGNAMQLQEALEVRSGDSQKGIFFYPLELRGSVVRHPLPACTKCCPLRASQDCSCAAPNSTHEPMMTERWQKPQWRRPWVSLEVSGCCLKRLCHLQSSSLELRSWLSSTSGHHEVGVPAFEIVTKTAQHHTTLLAPQH